MNTEYPSLLSSNAKILYLVFIGRGSTMTVLSMDKRIIIGILKDLHYIKVKCPVLCCSRDHDVYHYSVCLVCHQVC